MSDARAGRLQAMCRPPELLPNLGLFEFFTIIRLGHRKTQACNLQSRKSLTYEFLRSRPSASHTMLQPREA